MVNQTGLNMPRGMRMGEELREGYRLMDTEFQFNKMKSSEALLHNHGNILNITINCTGETVKML